MYNFLKDLMALIDMIDTQTAMWSSLMCVRMPSLVIYDLCNFAQIHILLSVFACAYGYDMHPQLPY